MEEITEKRARSFIMSGTAGYWAVAPNTVPIEHDTYIVVRLQGKFWLCNSDEITVGTPIELGVLAGRVKGGFPVEIKGEKLVEMAYAELAERGINLDDVLQKGT